jgi:hypothetical protein
MDNELMTVQQIAEKKGVTTRIVHKWIADCELEPEEIKLPGLEGGRPAGLYSLGVIEKAISITKDISLASQMSETGKAKFVIGTIELEGSPEQVQAMRAKLDEYHNAIEFHKKEAERFLREKDEMGRIAVQNNRAYSGVLRRLPRKELSEEEREWLARPTATEFMDKRFGNLWR